MSKDPTDLPHFADLPLETLCPHCHGQGYMTNDAGGEYDCVDCHNTGYFITEYGRKIIDFVKRHIRISVYEP